jgi:putative membrane protein
VTTQLDPGLQSERTAMAWQRTALGIGGVSALVLRQGGGDPLASAPGVVGLVAAVLLLVLVERRYVRTHRHVEDGNHPMGPGLVRALGWGTALLAVGALAVVASRLAGE